jgi:hypothetical protein
MILTPSRITASSWYRQGEPEWDAKTGPENLLREPGPLLGWLSAVGDVAGAWVEMEFDRPIILRELHVQNGWCEHPDFIDWSLHHRVEGVCVEHECDFSWLTHFDDVEAPQSIVVAGRFDTHPTRRVRINVDSTYAARFNVVGLGRLRVEGEWV